VASFHVFLGGYTQRLTRWPPHINEDTPGDLHHLKGRHQPEGPRRHPTHRGWPRACGIPRLTHDGPSLVPTCIRSVTKGVPVAAGTPSWFPEERALGFDPVGSLDRRLPSSKEKVCRDTPGMTFYLRAIMYTYATKWPVVHEYRMPTHSP